jgi:hypothetical protein
MASIIKIKRSGSTGSPTALAQGELAYSYLTGTQSNGGDRLYVGTGLEDSLGEAQNIVVIGGKYFADMMDHVPGVLTPTSAIITDSASKIDSLKVDNIQLNGNTISTLNTDGDLNLSPNGSGTVVINTDLDVDNINLNGNSIIATDSNGYISFSNSTAIKLPVGSDAQRPTAAQGQIRYNTDGSQFEGYNGTNWTGLGGVIDVDQDTKITAEQTSGSDSDTLKFFTGGTLQVSIDSAELALHGISKISNKSGDTLTIDPWPAGDSGTLVVLGNLKVEGTTTTINSTTVSLNDKNLVLADSAADSAEANNAGFTINGPANPVTLLYKATTDTIEINRPITGPGGSGLIFAGLTTDDLSEGSTNLYYTDERVDDRLSNLLLAGEAIDLTYFDSLNQLQIDVELATTTNPGAANFDSNQFIVTAGLATVYQLDGGTY